MKNNMDFAYQAVYRYLVRLVDQQQGELALKMPSLRQLAQRLSVSISTVQSAYSLLEKEGRVYSLPKSGYYSAPCSGNRAGRACSDSDGDLLHVLCDNASRPGMSLLGCDEPTLLHAQESPLPAMERELTRHYPRLREPGFQPFGEPELRTALAARYTRDAEHCWHADNVYIAPDLHGAFKAVIETLGLRGTVVLVESPCAWALLRLLQSFDIRVIELPLDETGSLDPARLDNLLRDNDIGLAVLPSLLNPVRGSVRPPGNSEAVAQALNRHQVWALENDSHAGLQFAYEQIPLRHWVDPQRLVIIGAFDKSLGPEAPYGYLLCKTLEVRWQQYLWLRAFELPPIRQRAIARLCSSGRLDRQLVALRETLVRRMQSMTQQLDEQTGGALRYQVPEGGCGVWAESMHPVDMRQVFDRLLAQRIVITPGELFSLQNRYGQHLWVSYAIDWGQDPAARLAALGGALTQARLY
ncbi:GntR family transcriptional regulator [Pseudomonas syringae pv. broussonetiae]|uniref:GntR family transcriptional regulator n=1 Tax=Pseudomonas savastanoi TaxID=29438 RepID=A0A3M5K174_PSESS|nr:PLP-dependent aminotransferase family protein [Pseudomonas savastanoi]KPW68958.1 GntR family transcriptional regulator [Pseudomonas syringae pv. broussonetiae]KWT15217.1 GntR family transcriptional regulator [Pseudomonas syringae pv. broussonetiae]RMS22102.1 GntR family transcriptional regulator [Pseudomonas savastanoi]RMT29308.1 GntR family transcriptional regulator [Pseudomonas savastanoi]